MTKKELTGIFICLAMLFFAANAFAAPVPATGQTQCYDEHGDMMLCPKPTERLYGQDANHADINPMSYTKLDDSGRELLDSATLWVMVRDNVTGLIWENKQGLLDRVKNYDKPHDPDNTYTWFDPTAPDRGKPGNGTDSKDFIDALNSASFGSFNDWRLPTAKELGTIVNYSVPYPGPTIDSGFFQSTVPAFYWSSTTYAYHTSFAWGVFFDAPFLYGYDYTNDKSTSRYIRAVRGGLSGGAYKNNGDGTVTDTSTGLMWQQTGYDITKTWEEALLYCEVELNSGLGFGGYRDWRMPNIKELRNLVDRSRYNPAINTGDFPDTVPSFYWSSTTPYHGTDYAWGVYFSFGLDHYNHKVGAPDSSGIGGGYVRCVRGGKVEASYILVLAPASRNVDKDAGATTFSVSNTGTGIMLMQWTAAVITPDSSWLSISAGASGSNSGTITCSFTANTSISVRTATIRVTATVPVLPGSPVLGSPVDVTVTQAPTLTGSLAASFGSLGLWVYSLDSATWTKISSSNPKNIIYSGSTLYADFGPSVGISMWDGSTAWSRITSASSENMVTSDSTLYADFGASYGLCKWDGASWTQKWYVASWTQLTPFKPENMVTSGSTLYVDFGVSYGLYKWDGASWAQLTPSDPERWTQLTPSNPEKMVASGSTLYASFGALGLWKRDGTAWSRLTTPSDPENMVASGSTLYVDFGASGLWKWDGTAWSQLTSVNPENMVASGPTLYANFGASGLRKWDGTAWSQLTKSNPEDMVTSGSTLYADFGASGLWKWDGTVWSQLTPSNPERMVVSN